MNGSKGSWPLATAGAAALILIPLLSFMGYPVSHLGRDLIGGGAGDAWLNSWILGQCLDNLLARPFDLGYANIFWGDHAPLAYTIAPYGIAVPSLPLYLATGKNLVLTYNLAWLSTWVFTAPAAWLLIRRLSHGAPWAVAISALAFTFAPFRFLHYGHLETLSMAPMLVALWSFHHLLEKPLWRWSVITAVATALTFATSGSLALVFAVGALAILVAHGARHRGFTLSRLGWMGSTLFFTALLLLPVTVFRFRNGVFADGFGIDEILRYRATLAGWLSSPSLIYSGLSATDYEKSLFPGFAVLALAIAAYLALTRFTDKLPKAAHAEAVTKDLPRIALLWAAIGFLLSLGPRIDLFGFSIPSPYALLMQAPAFSQIRVSARFGLLVLLALSILLPWGLEMLRRSRRFGHMGWALAAFAVVFLAVESIPHVGGEGTSRFKAKKPVAEKRLWAPMATPVDTAVYSNLATRPWGAVLDLPNDNRGLYQFVHHQRIHGKPILGGTGSYLPEWIWVWNSDYFPNEASLSFGLDRNLKYLVLHGELMTNGEQAGLEAALRPWQEKGMVSRTAEHFGKTSLYVITDARSNTRTK